MKTQLITPHADTHEERVLALASFPSLLSEFVSEFAKTQNAPWLKTCLDQGYFDTQQGDKKKATERIYCFFDFLSKIEENPQGVQKEGSSLALPLKDKAFGVFYKEMVAHLQSQMGLEKNPLALADTPSELKNLLALSLAGAIVLKDHETMHSLVRQTPELVNHHLNSAWMGPAFDRLFLLDSRLTVSPYALAMQMGNTQAMNFLASAGSDLRATAAHGGVGFSVDNGVNPKPDVVFDFVSKPLVFLTACSPSVLEKAVSHWHSFSLGQGFFAADLADRLTQTTLELIDHRGEVNPRKTAHVEKTLGVLGSMGFFESNATECFKAACLSGRHALASGIEGAIDWARLSPGPMAGEEEKNQRLVIGVLKTRHNTDAIGPVIDLIASRAERDGAFDRVFSQVLEPSTKGKGHAQGALIQQPMGFLIDQSRIDMVLLCMAKSMGPKKSPEPKNPTRFLSPIDYAEAGNKSDVAHAMRTFMNRQKALGVLADMDVQPQKSTSIRP